jgi:histone H3/H4
VSKLKKYVRAKSDMKTSDTVIPVLSQELRRICDKAIRVAAQNGRKTVMDRDVRDALKD